MPLIRFNFFQDQAICSRMMEAVRLAQNRENGAVQRGGRTRDDARQRYRIDDALEAAVIASVDGYSHPTSSVPMGGRADPGAVVDANGAVRGTDGLHVIDASIMPDIVSAPTNITTIMIAEAVSRHSLTPLSSRSRRASSSPLARPSEPAASPLRPRVLFRGPAHRPFRRADRRALLPLFLGLR